MRTQRRLSRSITAEWPTVTLENMAADAADKIRKRIDAVMFYLDGVDFRAIRKETGVCRSKVYYFLKRCRSIHEDGREWGFRGLLMHAPVAGYRRHALPPRNSYRSHGHSGLFRNVLRKYPQIPERLVEQALKNRSKGFAESSVRNQSLHRLFLEECRKVGIPSSDYPFTVRYAGKRTVDKWIKSEIFYRNQRAALLVQHGEHVARKLSNTGDATRIGYRRICYDRVEFDAHRLDAIMVIEIADPTGREPVHLPIERIWLLTCIDVASRAVLGYHISLARNYSAEDVLVCIENSLLPWKPRQLRDNGLFYPEGSGFPSSSIAGLGYARPNEIAFDNARSHYAVRVWEKIGNVLGCRINPGPVKTPEGRMFIERLFLTLEKGGLQRLPVTTGSSHQDARRRDPEEKAVKFRVHLEDIVDFMDVIQAEYNITPTEGLHGRSPLEYLRFAMRSGSFIVRQIPENERERLCLSTISESAVVRGKIQKGQRLHVRYMGVRYYSERLNLSPQMARQRVLMEINTRDLRTIRIFLSDGAEFGIVTASQEWAATQHDLRTRKAILNAINRGRLARQGIPDVVQHFIQHTEKRALEEKKARNDLARMRADKERGSGEKKPVIIETPRSPRRMRPSPPSIPIRRRTLNF